MKIKVVSWRLGFALLLPWCWVAPAAEKDKAPEARVAIELKDGSRIVGRLLPEKLPFESTLLGELEIPVERIRSIQWGTDESDAWLEAVNGDKLQIKLTATELRLTTSFGEVKLPRTSLRKLTVTLSGGAAQARDGLLALWSAEANARDSAGGHDGTLVGNTAYGPGRVGQSFVFDGDAGNGVRLKNPAGLELQDFTIAAWVKRSSSTTASQNPGGGMVFSFGSGGYCLAVDYNGLVLLSKLDVSAAVSSFQITDTDWHHLAATKSGSSVVFCLDGVSYPAAPYTDTFTFTTPAAIGARGDNLANCFLGHIDELAVYNHALSGSELEDLFALGQAGEHILPPRRQSRK